MLQALRDYVFDCLSRALRGSLSGALNWAGIIGVGCVGGYYQYRGLTMTDPHSWHCEMGCDLHCSGVDPNFCDTSNSCRTISNLQGTPGKAT